MGEVNLVNEQEREMRGQLITSLATRFIHTVNRANGINNQFNLITKLSSISKIIGQTLVNEDLDYFIDSCDLTPLERSLVCNSRSIIPWQTVACEALKVLTTEVAQEG